MISPQTNRAHRTATCGAVTGRRGQSQRLNTWLATLATLIGLSSTIGIAAPPGADGLLVLEVVDSESGELIPARVNMRNARGRAAAPRGVGVARHGDHFYTTGKIELPLRKGTYTFSVDAGVEYRPQAGHFDIERHADDSKRVEMRRFAHLADEGWYAGDVDVARSAEDLDVAMQAEGLWRVPLIAYRWEDDQWERERNAFASDGGVGQSPEPTVIEVTTPGGRLLCVSPAPLSAPPAWQAGSSLDTITAAKRAGYHVLAASPVEWEFPVWLATGKLDGVILFGNQGDRRAPHERLGDRVKFGGANGRHRWHEAVYFHALNAGLRLPPLGGSHTGPSEVPLGATRSYVFCGDRCDRQRWWQQALAGASVVSTGPLLRPRVGGDPPGQVFATSSESPVEFAVALDLATRTTVDYLEILKNGESLHEVRLDEWAAAGGKLPPVPFDDSGWFAVRAVTREKDRYDLALTAPYYVQSADGPRISRKACQFFLDWIDELKGRDAKLRTIDDERLAKARALWERRLEKANLE